MSRITTVRCDYCGKEVPEYEARGWFKFGWDDLPGKSGKALTWEFIFCSKECVTKWIKGLHVPETLDERSAEPEDPDVEKARQWGERRLRTVCKLNSALREELDVERERRWRERGESQERIDYLEQCLAEHREGVNDDEVMYGVW